MVYDRAGKRSGQAQLFLFQRGFENVRNLTGGVLTWIEAFGNVRPQLAPVATPSSPSAPPSPLPEPELPSTDSGTEDTSANDMMAEGPIDEATSEVDPSPEALGGDEDAPPDDGAEEVEEEVAPEDDPSYADSGDDADVTPVDDAEEAEGEFAPEADPR